MVVAVVVTAFVGVAVVTVVIQETFIATSGISFSIVEFSNKSVYQVELLLLKFVRQ